jgi:hypothetical protein
MDLSFLDGEDDFDEDVSRSPLHAQVHVYVCVCVYMYIYVCVLCYEPGVTLFDSSDCIHEAVVTE